jgi:hypothetical protein
MKRCSRCGETKPPEAFHRHRGRLDGRQTICATCKAAYNAAYYAANAARHRQLRAQIARRGRERISAAIEAVKRSPCADCGRRLPPHAMDLDHVRGDKRGDAGAMRRMAYDDALAEIAKCEVVCATCHRARTEARAARRRVMASYGWVPGGSNPEPAD